MYVQVPYLKENEEINEYLNQKYHIHTYTAYSATMGTLKSQVNIVYQKGPIDIHSTKATKPFDRLKRFQ